MKPYWPEKHLVSEMNIDERVELWRLLGELKVTIARLESIEMDLEEILDPSPVVCDNHERGGEA